MPPLLSQFTQNMSTNSTLPQGLKSCLEPFLHHPPLLNNQCKKPISQNQQSCSLNEEDNTAWNFLVAITNRKLTHDDAGTDRVYVHPLARSWSSSMSVRSLEMCTESLGSESGTYIDPITDEFPFSDPGSEGSNFSNPKTLERRNEHAHTSVIPPPLSSMHGGYCVHLLQIHREDGRLVIKASRFPSCRSCFKSKRGNGRLRMSLIQDVDGDHEEAENKEAEMDVSGENEEEKSKIGGKLGLGGEWSSSGRCNGEDPQKTNQNLPTFPLCVAMS